VHLLRRALEESATTADEKSVPGKYRTVVAILEEVADAVLSVAWGVQRTNLNGAEGKGGVVLRCVSDFGTVTTTNDWNRVMFEL